VFVIVVTLKQTNSFRESMTTNQRHFKRAGKKKDKKEDLQEGFGVHGLHPDRNAELKNT